MFDRFTLLSSPSRLDKPPQLQPTSVWDMGFWQNLSHPKAKQCWFRVLIADHDKDKTNLK